ncbi:uncharacterized protein LOC142167969 [Nicotiana tabacum]|uniref:Uncharacterized protein LOC142167969 n=1 Tax=Nicotiana tabacum TaxID=4097 RepID=A0AC58SID0_TOBAC
MKPFERKEVKAAIFQIDSNKSQGPDGYGSGFFKSAWPREEIIDAVLEFFKNGKLLGQLNETNIALIPKLSNQESMLHNVLICHDVLRYYNRKTSPMSLMKIDLKKVYDMFSISVNGESHGFFEGKEVLDKHLKLTHLIFVDDLMVFCKGETCSVNRVLEALAHFSSVSGLVANMDKSSLFMADVHDHMKEVLLRNTGFSLGTFPISFWGPVFVLPQSIMNEVDKKCRKYMWGGSKDKKKISLWQLVMRKESLWVKWIHDVYMKTDVNIWTHRVPQDCSWYWRKLNSLKEEMRNWYQRDTYKLGVNGDYSITKSYLAIKGSHRRWATTDLHWNAIAQPKHMIIMWLTTQGRLLTKARLSSLHILVEDDKCVLCTDQAGKQTNTCL